MKIKIVFFILTIIAINTAFGQHNYNINNIADSLKENANAIIRFYNTSYEIQSPEKYITHVHYAITILNPNGKQASKLVINYDRNSRVSDIKGFLYNQYGILTDKVKKKQIKDIVSNNNYTLFSDSRIKFLSPAVSSYPYTIEYKYTIKNSGMVGFNTWIPQQRFNVSVEAATLSVSQSEGIDISHKELNHDFAMNITQSGTCDVITWSVNNLKAIEYEPLAPTYLDFMPAVLLAPKKIEYEGIKGDFSTWKSYGKWVYKLIDGRDELPNETVQNIKLLTDTITNKRDKIKAIYKFMQGKTRYVNVVLGIGGFQPLLAKDVDEKGYGDCKALSNYTKALLKCIGVNSYYTEIGTGKYQEIKFVDFASANQTNHIILCVPMESDTIWLECTNQNIPFGYIDLGSQNRYALLIKPNGGELVKTPFFNAKENTRISNIKLEINNIGGADFEINTVYNNNIYKELFSLINGSAKEQRNELLENLSSSKNIEIEDFLVEDKSNGNAKASLYVKGYLNNFTSKTGSRMFLAPEYFHNNTFPDYISNNRKLDIYEPISYTYIDTSRIYLPKGYSPESIQNSVHFNSVYGQYSFEAETINNTIITIRKLIINEGQYSNEMFGEINKFLQNISEFENKKNIITKNK